MNVPLREEKSEHDRIIATRSDLLFMRDKLKLMLDKEKSSSKSVREILLRGRVLIASLRKMYDEKKLSTILSIPIKWRYEAPPRS